MQQTIKEIKKATLNHIAGRNPWVFAIAIFVTGFFCGVGFSAYRFGSESLSGSSTAQKTNYAQMAKDLERDLTENPENSNAWIQLGDVYFDSDKYAKTIDAYQKALSLNPKNADMLW
jgi:cytochrome c-type biogenesis protein CcmH/NrfG